LRWLRRRCRLRDDNLRTPHTRCECLRVEVAEPCRVCDALVTPSLLRGACPLRFVGTANRFYFVCFADCSSVVNTTPTHKQHATPAKLPPRLFCSSACCARSAAGKKLRTRSVSVTGKNWRPAATGSRSSYFDPNPALLPLAFALSAAGLEVGPRCPSSLSRLVGGLQRYTPSQALLVKVAASFIATKTGPPFIAPSRLAPYPPPSSQNNLAAMHRTVALGPTRFDCHSPLCRAWPHFPRFDSFTSLAFPTAFSTLRFHHRHLNIVLPLCCMARCRGRHSSSLSVNPVPSFSFSPQPLSVTIIQINNHSHRTFDLQRL
jgi:hypothetical protein